MARPSPQAPLERFLSETKEEVVRIWKEDVAKINKRLEALEPSSRLPTIPSPVRGKDFVREPNVTALMRAAIDFRNALIPDGEEKYIQFPLNVSDKKLNADAKDALEMIMIQKIGVDYGKLSWGHASRRTHVSQCEAVIRTACASKDFLVYKQSSNLWCIRWLAEQKMKSKGRLSVTRRVQQVENTPVNCIPENPSAIPNQVNDEINISSDTEHQANGFRDGENDTVNMNIRNSSNVLLPAENTSSPACHGLQQAGSTAGASTVLNRSSRGQKRAFDSIRGAERVHENINQSIPATSSLAFIPARESPSEADQTVRNGNSAGEDLPAFSTPALACPTGSSGGLEHLHPSIRFSSPVRAPVRQYFPKDKDTEDNANRTPCVASRVQERALVLTRTPVTDLNNGSQRVGDHINRGPGSIRYIHQSTPSTAMGKGLKSTRISMAPQTDNTDTIDKSILLRLRVRSPADISYMGARMQPASSSITDGMQNIKNRESVPHAPVSEPDALSTTVTAPLAQVQRCQQNHEVRANLLTISKRGRAQKRSQQNFTQRRGRGRGRGKGRGRGRISSRGGKTVIVRSQGTTMGLGRRAQTNNLH